MKKYDKMDENMVILNKNMN